MTYIILRKVMTPLSHTHNVRQN